MNKDKKNSIRELIIKKLDEAENHWSIGGNRLLVKSATLMDSISNESLNVERSQIPGFEFVNDQDTIVKDFIALVADMRNSSDHLLTFVKDPEVNKLQRVYYETSALLPAIAQVIEFNKGCVTEYLGDGVLALFKVDCNDKWGSIKDSYHAATDIICDVREIINNILFERYKLPPLQLGVGLSMSPMLVTLIGLDGKKQPKAIGNCIYKATKLSYGVNKIIIDEELNLNWKSSTRGRRRFEPIKSRRNDSIRGFITK